MKCRECGRNVPVLKNKCSNCGTKNIKNVLLKIFAILDIVLLFIVIVSFSNDENDVSNNKTNDDVYKKLDETYYAIPKYSYLDIKCDMSDGSINCYINAKEGTYLNSGSLSFDLDLSENISIDENDFEIEKKDDNYSVKFDNYDFSKENVLKLKYNDIEDSDYIKFSGIELTNVNFEDGSNYEDGTNFKFDDVEIMYSDIMTTTEKKIDDNIKSGSYGIEELKNMGFIDYNLKNIDINSSISENDYEFKDMFTEIDTSKEVEIYSEQYEKYTLSIEKKGNNASIKYLDSNSNIIEEKNFNNILKIYFVRRGCSGGSKYYFLSSEKKVYVVYSNVNGVHTFSSNYSEINLDKNYVKLHCYYSYGVTCGFQYVIAGEDNEGKLFNLYTNKGIISDNLYYYEGFLQVYNNRDIYINGNKIDNKYLVGFSDIDDDISYIITSDFKLLNVERTKSIENNDYLNTSLVDTYKKVGTMLYNDDYYVLYDESGYFIRYFYKKTLK